jgi:hypothetical protein
MSPLDWQRGSRFHNTIIPTCVHQLEKNANIFTVIIFAAEARKNVGCWMNPQLPKIGLLISVRIAQFQAS